MYVNINIALCVYVCVCIILLSLCVCPVLCSAFPKKSMIMTPCWQNPSSEPESCWQVHRW